MSKAINIICHSDLTTGGSVSAESSLTLEVCPSVMHARSVAAPAVNPEAIVRVHGNSFAQQENAQCILVNTRKRHNVRTIR